MADCFKTSDGCEIAYTLHNGAGANAPRIALIHSLALDRSIWDDVAQELSRDAQVLTWDCRGHGRSGQPLITYTPQLFARDLAELMDHVKWPSAVVGGCSMGGMVAQAFAIEYPKRTTGLALIEFLVSEEGQRLYAESVHESPLRPGVAAFRALDFFQAKLILQKADAARDPFKRDIEAAIERRDGFSAASR